MAHRRAACSCETTRRLDAEQSIEGPDTNGQFDELNSWKRERQERLDRLMKVVAERETAAAQSEARSDNDNRNFGLEQMTDANVTTTPLARNYKQRRARSPAEEEW